MACKIIAILLLSVGLSFAQDLKEQIVIAMPKAAWKEPDKSYIKQKFFLWCNVPDNEKVIDHVVWVQANDPTKEWYIASFWTANLHKGTNAITRAKLAVFKAGLTDVRIRVQDSDNAYQDLIDSGLKPKEPEVNL